MSSNTDLASEAAAQSSLRTSQSHQSKGDLQAALAALQVVESVLDGVQPHTAWKVVKRIGTLCNRLATVGGAAGAMEYLHAADSVLTAHSQRLERRGVPLSGGLFKLQSLTLNNLATWHKQKSNHNHALHYLLKAFKLGECCPHLQDPESVHAQAQTKLNMSAVFSEVGKHEEAIRHAEECLGMLQREMTLRGGGGTAKGQRKYGAMIVLFVVAFYNIGVSEEAQHRKSEALEAYRNAVAIGSRHLPPSNPALSLAKQALADTMSVVDGSGLSPQPNSTDKVQIVSLLPTPYPRSPQSPAVEETKGKQQGLKRTKTSLGVEERKTILRITRAASHHVLMPKSPQPSHGKSASVLPTPLLDPKFPEDDKYYSKKELEKLRKKLESGSRVKFVSSDQYVLTKITKTLNVSKDIQHLRPFSTSNAMGAWEKDEEEKRRVSALRLKRHPQSSRMSSKHGLEVALKLINRLKEEDVLLAKRSSVESQSRIKAKTYRKSIIPMPPVHPQGAPPQRLFFRPHTESTPDRTSMPIPFDTFEHVSFLPPKPNLAKAKEEIEKLMDEINTDLRGLTEKTEKTRSASDSARKTCELAHSTVRVGEYKQLASRQNVKQFTRESVEQLTTLMDKKKLTGKAQSRASTYKPPVACPY